MKTINLGTIQRVSTVRDIKTMLCMYSTQLPLGQLSKNSASNLIRFMSDKFMSVNGIYHDIRQ